MGLFEGKVALVTGGASGIGLATAERLLEEGARVVIADIDLAAGRVASERLGAELEQLDVSDPKRWSEVVAALTQRHGGIDIAFLNAGIPTHPPTPEGLPEFDIAALPDELYRRILGVNVDGVVFGARAVVPAMAERGGGAIVITASLAGLLPYPNDPIYALTKHAVVGFARSLASMLRPRGITVSTICPGGVATNILGPGWGERARARGIDIMPPSQIADAVVRAVASRESRIWVCQAHRDHAIYHFARIEGLEAPARDAAN